MLAGKGLHILLIIYQAD